jgi:hypothetical protein
MLKNDCALNVIYMLDMQIDRTDVSANDDHWPSPTPHIWAWTLTFQGSGTDIMDMS